MSADLAADRLPIGVNIDGVLDHDSLPAPTPAERFARVAASGVFDFIEKFSHVLFVIVGYIMKVAPIGAFGAMAFTIGKYGVSSLLQLGQLPGTVWLLLVMAVVATLLDAVAGLRRGLPASAVATGAARKSAVESPRSGR